MRLSLRVLPALVLAVGVATCSESPTDLHRTPLALAFAPWFSAQAAAIYRNLAAFAVTLDNVHVVVRAEQTGDRLGELLKDTTIAFPVTATQVTIDIDLTIQGSEQPVVATIGLREGSTIYFEGVESLVAKVGETASTAQPVEMSYVGPGATAQSIVITPQPATLALSTSFQFQAQVFDQVEHSITDLPLTWTIGDATIATVSFSGGLTALIASTAKTGATTLTVRGLNGVSAQVPLSVQAVARLVVIEGDNQTGIVAGALPVKLQVQAQDANGNPVIGATINFSAVDGRGSISPASATTDAAGFASASLTLGQGLGTYAFTATAAGAPAATARVSASAASGAAATLGIVGGNNQVDTVLARLSQPLSVKVTDSFGNPVAQQPVDFQMTSGTGGLLPPNSVDATTTPVRVTTGTDGVASVGLVGGTIAGQVRVSASVTQSTIAPVSFTATFGPATPVQLFVLQQPSASAQATVPLGTQPTVRVSDQFGNTVPVAGLAIDVSAVALGCTRCPTVIGARIAGAPASPSRTPAPIRGAPKSSRLLRSIAPSTTRLNVPTGIARTVSDTFPRGVGGTTRATTDANGVATFKDLSLDLTIGSWQLVFVDAREALASAFSEAIDLSAGPAESIVAWSGEQTSILQGGDIVHPVARVIDKVGNGVPKITVDWAAVDGVSKLDSTSTHTDADGFANPGAWQTPVGTALTAFSIIATATGLKLENSPLTFSALVQPPPLGQRIPLRVPAVPR